MKFIENLELDKATNELVDVYESWKKELKNGGDYKEADLQFLFILQNMARLEINIERVYSMRTKKQKAGSGRNK